MVLGGENKVIKRKKILIVFTIIIGALIVVLCILNLHVNKDNKKYILEANKYCEEYVEIQYPQFINIEDDEKRQKINNLILQDVEKIVQSGHEFTEEMMIETDGRYYGTFVAHLDYEICYLDEDFISIVYSGGCGHMTIGGGQGVPTFLMVSNIDIENEKIVTMDDFVNDLEELNTLLLEDKFECVSTWEGIDWDWRVSEEYANKESELLENLQNNTFDFYDRYVDWYIKDKRLVFVSFMQYEYQEYAIDLADIKGIMHDEYKDIISNSEIEVQYQDIEQNIAK